MRHKNKLNINNTMFAAAFDEMLYEFDDDEHKSHKTHPEDILKVGNKEEVKSIPWIGRPKKANDPKSEQFRYYSGEYNMPAQSQQLIDWMIEYWRKNQSKFGLVFLDSNREFSKDMKRKRWEEVGRKCEVTGNPLAWEDVHGDHAIPWIHGGLTIYENLRVMHKSINLNMKDRYFDEYVESGDWKNISV